MSIAVMTRVWEQSKQRGSRLVLLLALADHANDDSVCWPGVARLAERARIERRSAQTIIRDLEDAGEVYVAVNAGRGNSNMYLVTLGLPMAQIEATLTRAFGMTREEARRTATEVWARQNGVVQHTFLGQGDEPEKMQADARKGERHNTPPAEKVQSCVQKGDDSITRTIMNHHEDMNRHETPESAEAPPPTPSEPEKSEKRGKTRKTTKPTPQAVKVFRANAHRYPAKAWYGDIEATVGESEDGLEFWGSVIKAWVGLGWNPTNVKGMLEFYERREIPPGNGAGRRKTPPGAAPEPAGFAAIRAVLAREGVADGELG
jgi:hypothetical protein